MKNEGPIADGVNGVNGVSGELLKVAIVGGGLAGLTAAISLRQQGHQVEVYEQSRFANEIGAAIHVTPNATGILKQIGLDPRDSGAVPIIQSRYLTANNELLRSNDNVADSPRWQNPWLLAHRAYLHSQLKDAATSSKGEGRPVRLITSSKVLSVDPQTAKIMLEDGSTQSADILVGADGVHSNTRKALFPNAPQAMKTNHNIFRFIIRRQVALDDLDTKQFAEDHGVLASWYGPDRKIVVYPTSHNELLNFVCIHPASSSEVSDDYNKAASKSKLLEVFGDFHPRLVKLLDKVDPKDLKIYPLYDIETLPTFVSGRMALVGDAAHPFTPHLAQGGAMAIEDGVSLGVMLGNGTLHADVPERLQLYNKARYVRATTIQEYSRLVGEDGTAGKSKNAAKFKVHEFLEFGFSHDEIHASTQILREYKWKQHPSRQRWRNPLAFGLLPGPRQDAFGQSHAESLRQSTITKATIKLKTSATLLRNLFPNGQYSFEKPDTVAVASLSLESLDKMAWLAGGGYDLLALYIHDVCYKQADGRIIKGTYCPVMIENLADPILTGREELGVPKLFSDIEISRTESSCLAKVSWRGAQWAELEWKDLRQDSTSAEGTQESNEGLLVHKYIPSTGNSNFGRADADYDVLIPNDREMSAVRSRFAACPADVRLEIKDLGWEKLPTLHPVVSRLAELPVFETLGGAVVEYQGVPDFSNAHPVSYRP